MGMMFESPFIGGFKEGFESEEEKIHSELTEKHNKGEVLSDDEQRTLEKLEAKKNRKKEEGKEYPSPDFDDKLD